MDPISSSGYGVHCEENEMMISDDNHPTELHETVMSCRSLSRYEDKKFKTVLPQIIAAAVAGSLHVVTGISLAYSAILIPQLMDAQNDTNTDVHDVIPITKSDSSWITSSITLVAPPTAIIGGFIMDGFGRLNALKLATIPSILGWVLIAAATNVPMLLTGRVLTGIAAIWGTSPATVYVTEIGRPDIRGSLIALLPFWISTGMVTVYLSGWFMHWRLIAWLCNIYTVVPLVFMMFIPESPAWLVSKGRIEQARKSLEWFNKYQPQPEFKTETLAEMQLALLQKENLLKMEERERMVGNNFLKKVKLFLQPSGYKPFLILTGLFCLQQFSGIYVILFNGVTFFKNIGTEINPYMASVCLGIMRLIMTLANTWLMKRFNRRSLLMFSAAGMAVCMGISGLYTKWILEGTTTKQWIPLTMLMGYFLCTAVGLMPIPFTIIAELFPLAIRGISHSLVTCIANLAMFAALHSYYSLNNIFGGSSGIQYFYAIISLGALIFSYAFLPETHRKKLSEIEDYFWNHTTYLSVPPRSAHSDNIRKSIVKKPLYSINGNVSINTKQEKV